MIKRLPIYIYGLLIIISGIFLLFANYLVFDHFKFILGITITVAAIFAIVSAISRNRKQVQFAYHEMHGLALFVYGISILLICDTAEKMTSYSTFLFIFYAFSEIIFCSWLLNTSKKVRIKIIMIRLFLGLGIGIGAIAAMYFTAFTFEIFGVLLIIIGANIFLYVPVIKEITLSNNTE